MGRGKIEIKKIENSTNRQVTYSKRRTGIFKKAKELSVLCDAEVSIIMFSSTKRYHDYTSPSTTTKKIYDRYQKASGTDLWNSHYERMQDNLKKLKEVNNKLRREIRRRLGEDLNDMSIGEVRGLEQNMEDSLTIIRQRKDHTLGTQVQTYKKKYNSAEEYNRKLLHQFNSSDGDPHYGLVDNDGDYESALAMANGSSHLFAFRLQPNQPNLHNGGGYDLHDLRLG